MADAGLLLKVDGLRCGYGEAVVLIEHDMDLVFSFANWITVLVNGALLTEGPPQQIADDPQVRAVYLGETEVMRHG